MLNFSSRDKLVDPERKVNYVFYDPEMHWCPMCNVFPKSAKDYLNHLHSKEHLSMTKNQDSPWHEKQQNDVSSQIIVDFLIVLSKSQNPKKIPKY